MCHRRRKDVCGRWRPGDAAGRSHPEDLRKYCCHRAAKKQDSGRTPGRGRRIPGEFSDRGGFSPGSPGGLGRLKEQRKEWEKTKKQALNEKEQRLDNLRYRIRYTRKEMEDLEKRLENPEESVENTDDEAGMETARETERNSGQKLTAILILLALGGTATVLLWSLIWEEVMDGLSAGVFRFWSFWLPRKNSAVISENGKKRQPAVAAGRKKALKKERRAGQRSTWQELLRDKETLLYNLQEELEELENDNEQILKAQKEAESIALAEKMLAKAAGNLQSRRGNFLKDRTWEILGDLTQGKYCSGIIDENFQIWLDSGDRYVGLYQVSQGTVEQVYFALRMAAGELLCQEEELPVLLDETFAMYDDRRLCQALRWLHKNKSQVILFTCTRREIQAMEKLGIPWRQISL